MANLFRKRTHMDKLTALLSERRSRAALLADQRDRAATALSEANAARQRHMLEGDITDETTADKLQARVESLTSKLAGCDTALSALHAEIADIERKLADERAAVERKAASEQLAAQVAAIEAVLPKYLEQSRALADALSSVAHWHFESAQMSKFTNDCGTQLEVAAAFSVTELKGLVNAILGGQSPVPPKPEPQQLAVAPEPAAPTKTVFMLKSARFSGHDGHRRFAGQWTDQAMPVPLADRALRHGVAALTTHPMRATHLGMRGSDYVADGPDVVDLDTIDDCSGAKFANPNDPVLASANMTVIDRGPPRTVATAGPVL
jgi:hypothetical protein